MKNALAILVIAIILAMPVMGFCAILVAIIFSNVQLAISGFIAIVTFALVCYLFAKGAAEFKRTDNVVSIKRKGST